METSGLRLDKQKGSKKIRLRLKMSHTVRQAEVFPAKRTVEDQPLSDDRKGSRRGRWSMWKELALSGMLPGAPRPSEILIAAEFSDSMVEEMIETQTQ